MIKITLELWPFGLEKYKQNLGTIIIHNDGTGTPTRGNYAITLSKKGKDEIWKRGEIKDFPRKKLGAYDLLLRGLYALLKERNAL